jgi:hypothetical protein
VPKGFAEIQAAGINWTLVAVAIAVVAAGGGGFLLLRRKSTKENKT